MRCRSRVGIGPAGVPLGEVVDADPALARAGVGPRGAGAIDEGVVLVDGEDLEDRDGVEAIEAGELQLQGRIEGPPLGAAKLDDALDPVVEGHDAAAGHAGAIARAELELLAAHRRGVDDVGRVWGCRKGRRIEAADVGDEILELGELRPDRDTLLAPRRVRAWGHGQRP